MVVVLVFSLFVHMSLYLLGFVLFKQEYGAFQIPLILYHPITKLSWNRSILLSICPWVLLCPEDIFRTIQPVITKLVTVMCDSELEFHARLAVVTRHEEEEKTGKKIIKNKNDC